MKTIHINDLDSKQKMILYTISQVENGLHTETHIQKLLFLTIKALGIEPRNLGYYAHNYGPFSTTIKEICDSLINNSYLVKNKERGFILNSECSDEIVYAKPKFEMDRFKIKEVANFVKGLTRNEILLYTYVRNPDFAENSKILEEVLRSRIRISIEMVKKGKISLSCGAELANLSYVEFKEIIDKKMRLAI